MKPGETNIDFNNTKEKKWHMQFLPYEIFKGKNWIS